MKNKAPTKRMIFFFHNILNKVTSSTLTWVQKTLAASIRPTTHSKIQTQWLQMALRPLYCGKADMGKWFMEKKDQKILKRLFFSFCMERNDYCVTVKTLEAMLDWNYIKNNVIIKMEKPKKFYPLRPCWKGRHYQD